VSASRLLYLSLVLFLVALLWLNRDLLGEVVALPVFR